jgi:uncharacterized protein YjdB
VDPVEPTDPVVPVHPTDPSHDVDIAPMDPIVPAEPIVDPDKDKDADKDKDTDKEEDTDTGKDSHTQRVIEVNRVITKGSKINVNIIKRSKGSKVKYESSNKKVATITKSNGIITAKSEGTATINVTSVDKGVTTIYKINITVTNKQGSKDILDTDRNVYLGGNIVLNKEFKNVKYVVKDSKVISIGNSGRITPKKVGATKIKVTETEDQLQFVYTQKVNVKKPYIKFTKAVKTLKKGQTFNFNAKSYDSVPDELEWYSLNDSIVQIDYKTGVVKALKKGHTTIVVTCGTSVKSYVIAVK